MDGAMMGAGPNRDACRKWRGDLAMRSAGRVDPERADGLQAHLDGCAACRAELTDLQSVAGALRAADPAHLDDRAHAPSALSARILDAVGADSQRRRRRRIARMLTAAAAMIVVAVGVVSLVALDRDGDRLASVALTGDHGARGEAELVSKPWGTEVALHASGLRDGEVYWLWLTGDDGVRVGAGTFIGVGDRVDAVLAAGLPADLARRVWVTDEDDVVVLDALVGDR